MNQIPVRIDKKTEEKLRTQAKEREMKLSQYIRHLIEIGLKIEEMSKQQEQNKSNHNPILDELQLHKKWFQKSLQSSYETLYLTRYLLAHLPEEKAGEHHQFLEQAQTKAKALVEGLTS
jgi:hypothetical protein